LGVTDSSQHIRVEARDNGMDARHSLKNREDPCRKTQVGMCKEAGIDVIH
jgi:hypothetical protein